MFFPNLIIGFCSPAIPISTQPDKTAVTDLLSSQYTKKLSTTERALSQLEAL